MSLIWRAAAAVAAGAGAIAVWTASLVLGFAGGMLGIAGVLKPFNPDVIGLFSDGHQGVFSFTLRPEPPPGKDVFGMGFIPMALVAAILLVVLSWMLASRVGWPLARIAIGRRATR